MFRIFQRITAPGTPVDPIDHPDIQTMSQHQLDDLPLWPSEQLAKAQPCEATNVVTFCPPRAA